MARDIDHVVDTTADPIESFMVSSCTVTRELQLAKYGIGVYVVSWVGFQVDIHETIMRSPDCTCDTWPRIFDTEDTFDVITMQFFACRRIHDGRLNAEEGKGSAARFRGRSVCERRDDVRSSFCLPVGLTHKNTVLFEVVGRGGTSTTAHRSFPTIFLYHFQTSGAIGSPTDPRTRKLERSWWKC